MKHAERNYDDIQFESYRRIVEPKYNTLHDELEECYYDYWKKGLSKAFQGYDKLATPKDSRIQFEKLHGLIFHELALAMKTHHDSAITKEAKFDSYYTEKEKDKDGKTILTSKSKVEIAQERKTALNGEGYSITV